MSTLVWLDRICYDLKFLKVGMVFQSRRSPLSILVPDLEEAVP